MTTNNAPSEHPGKTQQAETIKTEIHLPSILGYEKIARGAAEALAEEIALPPDRIEDLKTAVAEACMNAIEHGNSLDSDIHVTVIMLITADKLEVRVADVGVQSIPDALPEPGTSAPMRGWGMFLIKNLVDEMTITHLPDGGNEVRMVIHLAPVEAAAVGEKSSLVTPADGKPGAVTPAEKKPSVVKPAEPKPSAVQTPEEKSRAVTPVEAKSNAVTPTEQKPSAVQTSEKKPSAVQSVSPKPGAVTPVEKKPSAVTPAKAKPSAVQTAEPKPSAVTPAEPKPSAVQVTEKKPSTVQTEQGPDAVQAAEKKPNAVTPVEQPSDTVSATKTDDETKTGTEPAGADVTSSLEE